MRSYLEKKVSEREDGMRSEVKEKKMGEEYEG